MKLTPHSSFPLCRYVCLLFGPLLAPLALPSHALPTTNPLPGISGLGAIPTTETVPAGDSEFSLGYEKVDPDEGDVDLLPVANVILGVKRGEIGATYVRERSDIGGTAFRNSYYALQGKARIYDRADIAVAVGAHFYDFGSEGGTDLGRVLSGYATANYTLRRFGNGYERDGAPLARFHGGFLLQRVRGDGISDTLLRPFAGAEYLLGRDVSLAADYLASDQNAARAYTLSLRYVPPQKPLSAQIGVGRLGNDTKIFVGLSLHFGGPKSADSEPIVEMKRPTNPRNNTPADNQAAPR